MPKMAIAIAVTILLLMSETKGTTNTIFGTRHSFHTTSQIMQYDEKFQSCKIVRQCLLLTRLAACDILTWKIGFETEFRLNNIAVPGG